MKKTFRLEIKTPIGNFITPEVEVKEERVGWVEANPKELLAFVNGVYRFKAQNTTHYFPKQVMDNAILKLIEI